MNNTYLYSQMFWTMSVCISSWICKGGKMTFHVTLKLMGFFLLNSLRLCFKPHQLLSLFWGRVEFDFQNFLWPSVYLLLRGGRILMQGDALSVSVNRKDKHSSKMKQPFQFSPGFIIKDFVLKLELGFFVDFFFFLRVFSPLRSCT